MERRCAVGRGVFAALGVPLPFAALPLFAAEPRAERRVPDAEAFGVFGDAFVLRGVFLRGVGFALAFAAPFDAGLAAAFALASREPAFAFLLRDAGADAGADAGELSTAASIALNVRAMASKMPLLSSRARVAALRRACSRGAGAAAARRAAARVAEERSAADAASEAGAPNGVAAAAGVLGRDGFLLATAEMKAGKSVSMGGSVCDGPEKSVAIAAAVDAAVAPRGAAALTAPLPSSPLVFAKSCEKTVEAVGAAVCGTTAPNALPSPSSATWWSSHRSSRRRSEAPAGECTNESACTAAWGTVHSRVGVSASPSKIETRVAMPSAAGTGTAIAKSADTSSAANALALTFRVHRARSVKRSHSVIASPETVTRKREEPMMRAERSGSKPCVSVCSSTFVVGFHSVTTAPNAMTRSDPSPEKLASTGCVE